MEPRKFKLLIVEDNQDDAFLLIHELKKAGYDIDHRVVCRETDLRQALKGNGWDCVTSDHKMPEFSAPEAVRIVREMAPDIPLVIVSGELDLDLAVNLLKCGADDYVHKNELPLVVSAIETAKKRSEVRIELKRERKVILEKERILRSYFDLPVVGAAILTTNQKVMEANPYLARLVGYDPNKLIGMDFSLLLSDDYAESISSQLAALSSGQLTTIECELSLHHRDGQAVQVHLSANYYLGIDDAPDYIMCVVIDRSKEAGLQQQVDESARLIELVSKTGPMAFYLLNIKTMSFEYASDKVSETYGLKLRDLKRVGASIWHDRLHPNDLRMFPRFCRNLSRLEDGKSLVARFRLRDGKGGYRTLLSENTIYKRDENGEPLIAFGIHIDETNQVRTEVLLSDMNQRYRALADAARMGIFSTSEDGTILSANPAMLQMLGYDSVELIGRHITKIAPCSHQGINAKMLPMLDRQDAFAHTVQKAFLCKDGAVRWTRTTITEAVLSDRHEHISLVQDLTEVVEALTRAQESEERLLKTFELCPEPLVLLDVARRTIMEVNEVFCEVLGMSKSDVHGLDIDTFATIIEDQGFGELLSSCVDGQPLRDESYSLKDAKGNQLWLYPLYTQFVVCNTSHCLVLLIDNTELIANRLKASQ